jgi:uncharacterized protein (TIGR04222 family)
MTSRTPSSSPGSLGDLGYDGFAYLRGGPRAAINSTLAVMHTNGLVDAWRTGMVMSREELSPILQTAMEHAVWSSLYEGTRPRTLATRPHTRRALNSSRAELIRTGALRPRWLWAIQRLLGLALVALSVADVIDGWGWAGAAVAAGAGVAVWFTPRQTIAGRRALVAARHRYPMPISEGQVQLPAETVGMAVALYGDTALLAIMGRFATQGGLLDRRTTNDELGDAPPSPSNPASKGY